MHDESVPAFRLEGVSFRYHGRRPAVVEVDLEVAPGEQLVVLGANGSGKTTLLKLLAGLYRPTEGRIWAYGEEITRLGEQPEAARRLRRRVGLVFQDPDVQLFSPTVFDDVAFGPRQRGWSEEIVSRRVARALEQLEIGHLAERPPDELSSGEKKRAAIAAVLSLEPAAILLDEPTAGLDPRGSAALVEVIKGLRRAGTTMVLATHALEIVPELATRVVVFGDRERRPVAEGTPEAILGDEELLVRTRLIHDHLHHHGSCAHSHPHGAAHHDHRDDLL